MRPHGLQCPNQDLTPPRGVLHSPLAHLPPLSSPPPPPPSHICGLTTQSVSRRGTYAWEYWIGDKGYYGLPEVICEYKKRRGQGSLPEEHEEFNRLLQFYRGRNEHAVSELVQSRSTLNTRWRGSFALLAAIARLSAHLSGLQERMRGPRYDCYGPWPQHPSLVLG